MLFAQDGLPSHPVPAALPERAWKSLKVFLPRGADALTLSHSHTLTLSHAHTLTRSHSHTLTRSHSHTRTLAHSHGQMHQASPGTSPAAGARVCECESVRE